MPARTDTSSIETGSSATMSSGRSTTARAMATRWRCPPLSSCGKRGRKDAGGRSPTCSSVSMTWRRRSRPACEPVNDERLGDAIEDREARIERLIRVLKDHLRLPPETQQLSAPAGHWLSQEADRAARGVHQFEDRKAGRGLAAAALADDAQDFARTELKLISSTARMAGPVPRWNSCAIRPVLTGKVLVRLRTSRIWPRAAPLAGSITALAASLMTMPLRPRPFPRSFPRGQPGGMFPRRRQNGRRPSGRFLAPRGAAARGISRARTDNGARSGSPRADARDQGARRRWRSDHVRDRRDRQRRSEARSCRDASAARRSSVSAPSPRLARHT